MSPSTTPQRPALSLRRATLVPDRVRVLNAPRLWVLLWVVGVLRQRRTRPFELEATPRIELGMEVLQTSALPLGYVATELEIGFYRWRLRPLG